MSNLPRRNSRNTPWTGHPSYNPTNDPFDSFDKTFKRVGIGFAIFYVAAALVSIALVVAVIWGIVQIVPAIVAALG